MKQESRDDMNRYFDDPERANGFITNFEPGIRKYIALHLAAWRTGYAIQIKNNATDVHNRPLPNDRALYVPGAGDLSKFWDIYRKVCKFLRL